MKNKVLKLTKLGILILGISLLLTNCQKQDVGIAEIEQDKYLVTRLKQKEFEKNIKLSNKLSLLKNKTKNSKVSSKSKDTNSQLNLYLNEATYIEDLENDYHSYTFSIYNGEKNFNIKNIVLSVLENGDYEAFSVTYYLTKEQRQLLDEGLYINLDDKMSIEPFDINQANIMAKGGGSGGCTVFVTYEVNCSCHSDEEHEAAACGHPNTVTESYRVQDCDGGGGGISGGTPPGGTNYGTPTGSIPPNTQPVVTSPISPDGSNVPVTNLARDLTLTSSQIKWLNLNTYVAERLLTYLVKERYSKDAKDYAMWEIEFEMLPTEPCGINHDCIKSIQTMADGLRRFHGEDGKLMANYLESLIADFTAFTVSDLQMFYDTAVAITTKYNAHMRTTIIMLGFVDGIKPIIEIALFEVGGSFAIKLLSKLPTVAKTLRITEVLNNLKITNSLSKFKFAQKFGIKTYAEHVKFFDDLKINRSELGAEIHHLVEKRFASLFSIDPNKMKSIVLTVEEHAAFTKTWRNKIPYTTTNSASNALHTATATKAEVEAIAREIYKNYPDILNILGL